MNIGLKHAKNHSQVGIKQDFSHAFLGIKKDVSIKEKNEKMKSKDSSEGIVNDYGKMREPLGMYSHSNQPKPVVQSNIERKKKTDKNGYNVDKNYVS